MLLFQLTLVDIYSTCIEKKDRNICTYLPTYLKNCTSVAMLDRKEHFKFLEVLALFFMRDVFQQSGDCYGQLAVD